VTATVVSRIIVASNNGSHCALITAINSGTLSFVPAAPTGSPSARAPASPAIYYARTSAGLIRNSLVVSRGRTSRSIRDRRERRRADQRWRVPHRHALGENPA
jgi:hypothetical protein